MSHTNPTQPTHSASESVTAAAPVLHLVGLNHTRAPLAVRELFAFSPENVARQIDRLKAEHLADEIMLLSTCNRTELYAYGRGPVFAARLRERFLRLGDLDPATQPADLYEATGLAAKRHFFAVGAGLDSMIVGETQIKAQVREAYRLSKEAGLAGARLRRLVEAAHHAGKRIRTETDLNVGTLCVGKAAVLRGEQHLGNLHGRLCMVVGAGKIGRRAALAIAERRPARLWIVNRTPERAAEVAAGLGGEPFGIDDLLCLLPEAELVIGAAYAPELVLSAESYTGACAPEGRPSRVCFVDAAVPRIFDPALDRLEGVARFDIDHLGEIVDANRRRREHAARHAWTIIDEEIENFAARLQEEALGPHIRRLNRRFKQIFEEEHARNGLDETAGDLDRLQRAHDRLRKRLMHETIQHMKQLVLGERAPEGGRRGED